MLLGLCKSRLFQSVYEEFDVAAPEDGWHCGFEGAVGFYQGDGFDQDLKLLVYCALEGGAGDFCAEGGLVEIYGGGGSVKFDELLLAVAFAIDLHVEGSAFGSRCQFEGQTLVFGQVEGRRVEISLGPGLVIGNFIVQVIVLKKGNLRGEAFTVICLHDSLCEFRMTEGGDGAVESVGKVHPVEGADSIFLGSADKIVCIVAEILQRRVLAEGAPLAYYHRAALGDQMLVQESEHLGDFNFHRRKVVN